MTNVKTGSTESGENTRFIMITSRGEDGRETTVPYLSHPHLGRFAEFCYARRMLGRRGSTERSPRLAYHTEVAPL